MTEHREDPKTLSEDLFSMRGLGILLVVFVHVVGVDAEHGVRKLFPAAHPELQWLMEFIHNFNMAVMLIGSGVAVAAFGRADTSLSQFARKKLNKLIVPMLIWAPVLMVTQQLLKSGLPKGVGGWLELVLQVPSAWFPPYSIFWFVHVLVWATLFSWLFRRFAAPRLGRWAWLLYLAAGVVLHLAVKLTRMRLGITTGHYLEFTLYWNRFFSLGLFIYPWLAPARALLERLPGRRLALVATVSLVSVGLMHSMFPKALYLVTRVLTGPLAFCVLMMFAVLLRTASWGRLWKWVGGLLRFTGANSMNFYLFHIYFVSGTRILVERVHPGTPLAVHLMMGCLVGYLGPYLLFWALKERRSLQLGHTAEAPAPALKS
jgi:fucose 4-O-acetylase-like acetyltransferase